MRKYIYKMTIDCVRDDLKSTFIATEEEVNSLVGKSAVFYEPFGKHSEVQVTFDREHFERVDCEESTISLIEGLGILPVGHHPFDVIE